MNCFTKIPNRKKNLYFICFFVVFFVFFFWDGGGGGGGRGARVGDFFLLRIQVEKLKKNLGEAGVVEGG